MVNEFFMTSIPHNPAGRIYSKLHRLNGQTQCNRVADILGVNDDRFAIMEALVDLRKEFLLLSDIIEQSNDLELCKSKLPKINDALNSIQPDFRGKFECKIPTDILTALEFIADILPDEEYATPDEISELHQAIDDLRHQIDESHELPEILRMWLLDLVRLMRDGIDRHNIRGLSGLREQYYTMLGNVMSHYKKPNHMHDVIGPAIYDKLYSAGRAMFKLVFKSTTITQDIISYFGDDPDNPTNLLS